MYKDLVTRMHKFQCLNVLFLQAASIVKLTNVRCVPGCPSLKYVITMVFIFGVGFFIWFETPINIPHQFIFVAPRLECVNPFSRFLCR
jgi:hypothetical protein